MTTLTNTEAMVVEKLNYEFPLGDVYTRDIKRVIGDVTNVHQDKVPQKMVTQIQDKMTKIHKGYYNISALAIVKNDDDVVVSNPTPMKTSPWESAQVAESTGEEIFVPEKSDQYVRWGHARDIETIIGSGKFYPIWIAGLSGNGKTFMVDQACAKLGREMLRVQISEDTDEDALIGGFRLVNGETVFAEGPVVRAMKRGAVLLIDEIDRPERPLMCLQGVLEGKPILIKKTGELVKPAPGFTVIATGNTLGRGSDDGKFISARILDEALLERFVITFNQPYPNAAIEKKIIMKHMELYGKIDDQFADMLIVWADAIRKTYEDDGIEDVITTRRLCHIVHTFSIFGDRAKAIDLCISRFDEDSRAAFKDLYDKIDPSTMDVSGIDSEVPY